MRATARFEATQLERTSLPGEIVTKNANSMGASLMNPTSITHRAPVSSFSAPASEASPWRRGSRIRPFDVTIVDQHNYHLFQPLPLSGGHRRPVARGHCISYSFDHARCTKRECRARQGREDRPSGDGRSLRRTDVSRSTISSSRPARSTPISATTSGGRMRRASRRSTTRHISGAASCLRSRRRRPSPIRPNARGF